MNLDEMTDSASRFTAFVEELANVIGHSDRVRPLKHYCTGLLVSEGRRSVEPIAAVTAPAEVSVQHQKLLHFVANAPWDDQPALEKVCEMVLPAIERHEPIKVWILDDTSFPKYGSHSVGVHHQYCGQLGKQANCQVAVTLSIANHHASLPIAYRLHLPQAWAEDAARRKKAGIPKAISFKTKPQIALEQIRESCAAGVPRGVVLMDASYGRTSALRAGISALGLTYVAAIVATLKVRRCSDDDDAAPEPRLSVKQLALRLPKHAWRTVTWREGTNKVLRSRFARVRVHTSPTRGRRGRPEETLLIEWPNGEPQPTKYWLATVDKNTSFRALVDLAKMRWRIERDYLELKQEIGLGHYEGRGWRGFHHHGTLCIAAYGFLISERERIPPSEAQFTGTVKKPALPKSYRPRGASDPPPTSRSQLDCDSPPLLHRRHRKSTPKMSLLHNPLQKEHAVRFMTQYD
jgi:SRSO17 transposase